MKVERSFLVRVVQVYEGDLPSDENWGTDDWADDWMYGDHDQYICDNWKLVSDETELIDNDNLDSRIIED